MRPINKKGQLTESMKALPLIIIALIIMGTVLLLGFSILGDVSEDFAGNQTEINATTDFIEGAGTLAGQTGNLALLAVLVIIIGALFGVLGYFMAKKGFSIK